jgi:quinolinate synthase
MIQSGGDVVVMRHPEAAQSVMKYVDTIMSGGRK